MLLCTWLFPLSPYLAWWLIPWSSTLIFPTVWWLDGLGWYTSPVCRLTPILLMISIWVRCPFLPARYIHYRGFGSLLIAPWCHYSWWMCATRVMWILLELWFVCSIVRLFAFPFITEVTWYLVWCFLHFLDAETSDSTLSRLIVCVPPLALYTRHPLHVPLGLQDPRILGSFP